MLQDVENGVFWGG